MQSIKTINDQPACLYILFLAEMWERFGFYIVQILLIFYLTDVCNFSDTLSAAILGAFTAVSYISTVAGGYLANRFLGYKHAVVLGGVLLSLGYALLAMQQASFFYLALSTIAIGTGFFKPSITSYLGDFYSENDNRCERGYTIFYIGINVGIVLATTSAGYTLRFFGWSANFLGASLGLLIAVGTFVIGLQFLQRKGQLIPLRKDVRQPLSKQVGAIIYSGILAAIYLFSLIIKVVELASIVFIVGAVGIIMALLWISYRADKKNRGKMLACLLLLAFSTLFWALYYQLFFVLNLFIDRVLDRNIWGHQLPSPFFISLVAIFIMLFGPAVGWLWQTLARKNFNPSSATKFALSLFCMAAGFLFLLVGTYFLTAAGLVNKYWVVVAYLFFTMGELLISPICISMVVVTVPSAYVGIMMGAYLSAIGFGAKLAGVIAKMAAISKAVQSTAMMVVTYQHAFSRFAAIAVLSGLVILAAMPFINWLMEPDGVDNIKTLRD